MSCVYINNSSKILNQRLISNCLDKSKLMLQVKNQGEIIGSTLFFLSVFAINPFNFEKIKICPYSKPFISFFQLLFLSFPPD